MIEIHSLRWNSLHSLSNFFIRLVSLLFDFFSDLSPLFCFYRNGVPWRRESEWRPTARVYMSCSFFFFFIILLCWILKSDCFFRPKELQNKRITEQPKTNQVCAVNCKFFIMLEANVHCKGHFSSRTLC